MTLATHASARSIEATFAAEALEDAMAAVKRALGPDALILSSRRLDRPGRAARFEVRASLGHDPDTAAALDDEAPPPPPPPPSDVTPRATSLLERVLRENDIPASIARELTVREARAPRSLAELRDALVRLLRTSVGFGESALRARVVAIAGPTGVGKTTTVAKLAARDALVDGLRVALISTDDYRVGGADQLARFAELMDVPFAVAPDEAGFARALSRFAAMDRIYVDTAGRSPRDLAALPRTARLLKVAQDRLSVALCVPANARSREVTRILEQHAPLAPRALIATKLDEAELFGAPLLAALLSDLPIAHFANGQRVPEDLEPAAAERLATLLLGEESEA